MEELIKRVRKYAEDNSFDSWEQEIEEEGYAIAGDFFGHSDDCFEKGQEYGEILLAREILTELEALNNPKGN